MNIPDKQIFEFTYGEYRADDRITGVLMVIMSFFPHLIAMYTISIVIFAKCFHHLVFLVGLLSSHEIAKIMKKICKHPRPPGAFLTSYGMPSDHAMFMIFINTYVVLLLNSNYRLKKSSKVLTTGMLCSVSVLVGYSRIYLGVHSLDQIVVGNIMGLAFGYFWFSFSARYILASKSITRRFESAHTCLHDIFLGSVNLKDS